MPSKSPSKYLSLKYLVSIAESDFCNRDKGIDYEPSEVLALIYEKQNKTSEVFQAKLERANNLQIIELLLKSAKKPCTLCGQILHFSKFHKDKSKKSFGLRSHCRECRSIPF
jgi:hypothetical protein